MGLRREPAAKNAADPRVVLHQLIATCWAAGRHYQRAGLDQSPALRRCSIELALIAEACGADLPDRDPVPVEDGSAAALLRQYREAMRAPLPRAVQAVLKDHLGRLEASFAPLVDAAA
jgi:hypothetical protein